MRRFRLDHRIVAACLAALGDPHINPNPKTGERRDAGETGTFTRKLEYVLAKTFDRKYPDLKARLFLPVNSEIPEGAESFVWRSYDYAGMAKIIVNFADDLPLVDVMAGQQSQILQSVGDGYVYSIQDLRASTMNGAQLDTKRAAAAKKVCDNRVEQIAATGDAKSGLPGFLNNPNVTILSAPGDINGDWPNATSEQILNDLNTIASKMVEMTMEAFKPDTLLLPTSRFQLISKKIMASGTDSRTVLKVFLENSTEIRNVDSWSMLNRADAAGTGPRAVAYVRAPENVELIIPKEFEQFPPQPVNLAFKVPCHMRIGGVVIYYPLSAIYIDGI